MGVGTCKWRPPFYCAHRNLECVSCTCAHLPASMQSGGFARPSRADELLTAAPHQALALIDIKTLDHFVVAGSNTISFAERGLI